MTAQQLLNKTTYILKQNSPKIFAGLGVVGVATTSYLAAKATVQATDIIRANEASAGRIEDRQARIKEHTKHVWKLYVPTGVSGAATVACIVGSSRVSSRRTVAAVTAYSLTEKAFSEYRQKVVEQIGVGKEQKIRDEVAQDQVSNNKPNNVIIAGKGEVLCCELYTGRYFKSEMEALKKAENEINHMIINQMYVTLDEFYYLIGIGSTCVSNDIGWDSDKLMELEFSTTLTPDGEPCLAFKYNYVKPLA